MAPHASSCACKAIALLAAAVLVLGVAAGCARPLVLLADDHQVVVQPADGTPRDNLVAASVDTAVSHCAKFGKKAVYDRTNQAGSEAVTVRFACE